LAISPKKEKREVKPDRSNLRESQTIYIANKKIIIIE
jgi:hypothetical protein